MNTDADLPDPDEQPEDDATGSGDGGPPLGSIIDLPIEEQLLLIVAMLAGRNYNTDGAEGPDCLTVMTRLQ